MKNRFNIILVVSWTLFILVIPFFVSAHRSGCHRWHSCPSDTGSYICGDSGHPCKYPKSTTAKAQLSPSQDTTITKQKKVDALKKQIMELKLKLQQLQNQLTVLE